MIHVTNLSRRKVLKALGVGSGLLLGVSLGPDDGAAADTAPPAAGNGTLTPNIFLSVDSAGTVTLTVHRPEMGQGIRTTFAMIMADELAASWARIVIRQADGDPRYGDQDTDASRSMRLFHRALRFAAAAARQMLEAAAAQAWRASIADCRAVDHEVIHVPTGRVLGFALLAKPASALPVPNLDKIRLEDRSTWRYVGHMIPGVDVPGMVSGKTLYGADLVMPDLKFASIERCPVYGGKVKAFDGGAAMQVRGVERVIEIPASPLPTGHLPLGGVAVIANNSWSATEARRKLHIDWDLGANATHDSVAYKAELETAARRPGRIVRSQGNFDAAFSGAAAKVSAEYFVPYQPHATMEPPAAVAIYKDGKLLILAPTQSPQSARAVVAQYLGMKEADVTVRPTFLGNGFGRKAMHDFVCEAAWLAKTLGGGIKLFWTRQDDLRHGYYHPVSVQRLDGGVDKNGLAIAWRHRTVFPTLTSTFKPEQALPDATQLGQGVTDVPYAIGNLRCEVGLATPHVRLGAGRGGLSLSHAFATCSFIDEMASAAGKDPANFLYATYAGPRKIDLKALGVDYPNYGASIDDYPVDVGRLQNILQFVTERSGWGEPLLPRQGRGIAVHRSYLSYAAAVIVVTVAADGQISIPRVDLVIDCGQVINPDRVRALMEDSIIYGLGFALYSNLTFKNGAVEQSNLDDFKLARADITPEMHIHIVPSTALPSGAGDPGVPVIAPALCNAIFAATGKRIRSLPVDTSLLKDDHQAPTAQPAAAPAGPGIPLTPAGPIPPKE